MLDSLDTLIAFVLIMLGVSLLITIAVQMVSAAFNLRDLNLAQGLKRTFSVISPDSDKNAKELANFVLKGRFLSDSFCRIGEYLNLGATQRLYDQAAT
jgi:hypothetical protein